MVGFGHQTCLAKITLPFGIFLGQNVVFKRFFSFDFAASGYAEPFRSAPMGFKLGHDGTPPNEMSYFFDLAPCSLEMRNIDI